MNNQNQNLEARGVSLTPAQWERCDRLTDEYGKRSRNAFIREAVDGVGVDGRIGMYVEEKNRSWCTSSAANDHRAITIEVASDTTEPYAVRDNVFAALLDLVTDICKRNGIKKLV